MRTLTSLVGVFVGVGLLHAADQTILGKQLLVKDPKPGVDATKRKIVAQGKEKASGDTIVGDPTVGGATVTVFVEGATSANQVFLLPQGTDPATGKPFWSAAGSGFKYKDAKGANGPVKLAQIRKSGSGTFQIKVVALGKNEPVTLTPPNPGTSGCMRLEVEGGDRYHVLLPPAPNSTVKKNDAQTFLLKDALAEGLCPGVCGNGVRDSGEQCDGGPACTSDCVQRIPGCCRFAPDQCTTVHGYSSFSTLLVACFGSTMVPPGGNAFGGAICQPDGSCSIEPMEPVSVCCQRAGTCEDVVVTDTRELYQFHSACQGPGTGVTVPAATCGAGGACVPQ